jgi:hypothetical protein
MAKLEKKVKLALFLENQFMAVYRKIENFLASEYPKIFFHHFPAKEVLANLGF